MSEELQKKDVFDEKAALTDADIKRVWEKFLGPDNKFKQIQLSQLDANDDLELYTLIFTGDKKDEYNNGNDHHWLIACDNYIFDSYGASDYKTPSTFKYFKHFQYQEFNSSVCGEYCLVFAKFVHDYTKDEEFSAPEIITKFQEKYKLSPKDKLHNDKTILQEYKDIAGKTGHGLEEKKDSLSTIPMETTDNSVDGESTTGQENTKDNRLP